MDNKMINDLQDQILIRKWHEMVYDAEMDDLKMILAELRCNHIQRDIACRNLLNGMTESISVADNVSIQVYCVRLREMTLPELRDEAIARYQEWIDDTHAFEEKIRRKEDETRKAWKTNFS